MSVRVAELLMGLVTLALSIALMVKSAELNIGWIPGRGPGSGMWPFWLSLGMGLASIATIVRWFLKATPESRSRLPYIESETVFLVAVTALGLLGFLILIEYAGIYLAVAAFLAFYLKVIGRHSWKMTMAFVLGGPVFIYLLFEVALTKYLPKGLSVFEDAFLEIDNIRYEIQYSDNAGLITAGLAAWVGLSIAAALYAERRRIHGILVLLLSLAASPLIGFLAVRYFGKSAAPET
ncbi:MAG: tripartite tricarboxylate transporter TctB family protein [Pseudomonadota bacterium]